MIKIIFYIICAIIFIAEITWILKGIFDGPILRGSWRVLK